VTFVEIRPTAHYFVLIPTILNAEIREATGYVHLGCRKDPK
jgi:hypothetical protein